MKKRPTSVSVVAWFLIVAGVITLISMSILAFKGMDPRIQEMMSKSLIPISVQYAMAYVNVLIGIVSGIAMLKGRNWARLLYVIYGVISYAINFIASPIKPMMIPGIVLFAIIVFFLFRPKSNAFFSEVGQPDNA